MKERWLLIQPIFYEGAECLLVSNYEYENTVSVTAWGNPSTMKDIKIDGTDVGIWRKKNIQ